MSDTWNDDLKARAEEIGLKQSSMQQNDIDNLFPTAPVQEKPRTGVELLVHNSTVNYERLPMLEIVFDRLCRTSTTTLRNLTNDNVEVNLEGIQTRRFGQFMDSVPLPCAIIVFKAVEWDNYALGILDTRLVYSMVDVLLGGRRGISPLNVDGRNFTTVEKTLIKRMFISILEDLSNAFAPISDITFTFDRIETNPRFCAITRPPNAVIEAKLRIDMEDRGGFLTLMLPYATLEPIREKLLQQFMGEKFGRDSIWENHLKKELLDTDIDMTAVLSTFRGSLRDILNWKIGTRLMLNVEPTSPVTLQCGNKPMFSGKMGRKDGNIAVRLDTVVKDKKSP